MDDDYKDYKKVKRQQKLYKPGSGPLRRSRYGLDAKMDSYGIDNGSKEREAHYGSQHSVNGDDVNVTCREVANLRNRKPEQQLYVPRTGDSYSDIDKQSKTSYKCDNSSQYNKRRITTGKQDNHASIGNSGSYSRDSSEKDSHYKDVSCNDVNYNRHYRQGSEPRSASPSQNLDQKSLDRNRDSRSMETWAGRHKSGSGGKPPSGRRNSAGFPSDSRPKHINLDNIPPRFRKKYLEQSGHQSFESVDQLSNKDRYSNNDMSHTSYGSGPFYSSNNTNWSQTLPSRGRGRLKENEHFDREKFINSYLKNYEVQNSRRSTPSNSYMNLYETVSLDKSACDKSDSLNSDYQNKKNSNDRGK